MNPIDMEFKEWCIESVLEIKETLVAITKDIKFKNDEISIIRDLREDNGLTQQQCAEIANISKNSYIRYENGMRAAPSDVIIAFAKYYNISADYILGLIVQPRELKNE